MTTNQDYAQKGEEYRLQGLKFQGFEYPKPYQSNSADTALENFQKAKEAFDQAIVANDNNAWVFAHRGATYRMLGWIASTITEKEKNYRLAVQDLEKAIELNPKYAWAYAHQGESYCSWGVDFIGVINKENQAEKNLESAIAAFQNAIEINSKYAWAYAHKGVTHRFIGGFFKKECKSKEQKNFEQAVEDLEKATQLDPKYAWAYANLATVYREKALAYGWLQEHSHDESLLQKEKDEWKLAFINVQKAIEIFPEIFTKSTLRKNSIIFTGQAPIDVLLSQRQPDENRRLNLFNAMSRGIEENPLRNTYSENKYVLYAKAVNKVYSEGLQAAQEDIDAAMKALRSA